MQMASAAILLAEFEQQAPLTRKFLERLPEEKLTWRPHAKSMTAGQLAYHLAEVPGRVVHFVENNPVQAPEFGEAQQPKSVGEILKAFDESIASVRKMLPRFNEAHMEEVWRMLKGETELFAMPRGQFLRSIMLNHWYQHRGQFSVYLRLLNIAVPSTWGPSADERPDFARRAEVA
jgi:uncharacterized damage-inducible protein DinB